MLDRKLPRLRLVAPARRRITTLVRRP